MTTTQAVIDLRHAPRGARIGGKARGLAGMIEAGERVPPAFVVPADMVRGLRPDELEEPLSALGADRVAVRSSAESEDGETTTMAGQFETILGVEPSAEAVFEAISAVAASGPEMSVVVQELVEADRAGVAFSVNPLTGDRETTVTAVPGTGDALVAGEAVGESWTVRGDRVDGESELLEVGELREIARAAARGQERLGAPADIEWAIAKGELFLLQCRPMTAVPIEPEIEVPPGSWEKDVTHYTGPMSPMFVSIDPFDEELFGEWAERWGLMIGGMRTAYLGGEAYSQPVPLFGPDPDKGGSPPPWWLLGALSRIVPPVRRRMASARRQVESGVIEEMPRRWRAEWKPALEGIIEGHRTIDLTSLSDGELVDLVEEQTRHMRWAVEVHFDLFVPYLVKVYPFVKTAEELLGWDADRALSLLAGHSPASANSARLLRPVAAAIAADPDLAADAESGTTLAERLRADAPEAADALERWIATEGFRTTGYDFAAPIVSEIPGLLDRLLQAELDRLERGEEITHTEAELPANLDPPQKRRFDEALAEAREFFPLREENVHLTGTMVAAALHRSLREIGNRLAGRGQLSQPRDIFMLEWDEARSGLFDGSDKRDIARRRRLERAWVEAHPGPMVHGTEPGSPPDLRGLPEHGRMINEALIWAMQLELAAPPERKNGIEGELRGTACSPGTFTGPARIVRSEADFDKLRPGDVLVCPVAPTSWAALLTMPGGLVCDSGGPMSHAAIVAREQGLPAVMATGDATSTLADGDIVTVDGSAGTVCVD